MIILLYTIAAYGLANLLVYGTGPFDMLVHFRRLCGRILPTLGDMLECMMCTSANVGWIVSALNLIFFPDMDLTPFKSMIGDPSRWYVIVLGDLCFTSGAVWLIHSAQEALETIGGGNG